MRIRTRIRRAQVMKSTEYFIKKRKISLNVIKR